MSSIPTPAATTLSTPSPTERPSTPTPPPTSPAAAMQPRAIYLIVATSIHPPLGIGLRGQLPWPPLKADMSLFKRVTTRRPPPLAADRTKDLETKNAVIMGRKTWDSIPPKFRPLRDRINVVVSRSKTTQDLAGNTGVEDVLVTPSLSDALSALESLQSERKLQVGKTFIIGGGEIYRAAVRELVVVHGVPLRVITTQVRRRDGGEIECDAFFPVLPWRNQSGVPETSSRLARAEEVEDWVGEQLPQRGRGAVVDSGDDSADLGPWLEEGELQIRVLGEEITKA